MFIHMFLFCHSPQLAEGAADLLPLRNRRLPAQWNLRGHITLCKLTSPILSYCHTAIPSYLQVGGSGALFGLFGVLLVELLQGWCWVTHPWVELVKLIIFIIVMLGTTSPLWTLLPPLFILSLSLLAPFPPSSQLWASCPTLTTSLRSEGSSSGS